MKSEAHKKFARNFLRIKGKIKNTWIRDKTGISLANLWHYSLGHSIPEGTRMSLLAKAFGIKEEEFFKE